MMTFRLKSLSGRPGRSRLRAVAAFLTCGLVLALPSSAQSSSRKASPAPVDTLSVLPYGRSSETPGADALPEAARARMGVLNVKNADLRDVFRGIAHQYDLNLVVDNAIEQHVTVRLSGLPVVEALVFLCRDNELVLTREGHILRVSMPPPASVPPPPEPAVSVRDSLLDVDLEDEDLERVMRTIARKGGVNILVRRGVHGSLTGALRDVPLDQGLRTLVRSNGFSIRESDGIYHIDRTGLGEAAGDGPARAVWVHVEDSLVTLDVLDASIEDVLREVAGQTRAGFITYDAPKGRITARADGLTLDETLDLLLRNTESTYRKVDDLYYVGDRHAGGIAATRLLRLSHIRADALIDLIPDLIGEQTTIRVVKEHNGLLVTGANDAIVELERLVHALDYPTPQILIEALVVDFAADDVLDLGLFFGRDAETAAAEAARGFRFQGTFETGDEAGLHLSGDGPQTRQALEDLTKPLRNLFGVGRIARLPDDFFLRIHALSAEGKATIRSRPQIATLNGHTASLIIGTTQYYLLRSDTPYQSPNSVLVQQSQRFEKIEANVKLEITPWVNGSGEITADIRPEFSTPVGDFNPEVPPTINSRVLESTVRLRDGETIILGGLIQEEERAFYHKVPILGSLPLLGRLFRSTSRKTAKSELLIFLTPHVFYGDEYEAARWKDLHEKMDLESMKEPGLLRKLLGQHP